MQNRDWIVCLLVSINALDTVKIEYSFFNTVYQHEYNMNLECALTASSRLNSYICKVKCSKFLEA